MDSAYGKPVGPPPPKIQTPKGPMDWPGGPLKDLAFPPVEKPPGTPIKPEERRMILTYALGYTIAGRPNGLELKVTFTELLK